MIVKYYRSVNKATNVIRGQHLVPKCDCYPNTYSSGILGTFRSTMRSTNKNRWDHKHCQTWESHGIEIWLIRSCKSSLVVSNPNVGLLCVLFLFSWNSLLSADHCVRNVCSSNPGLSQCWSKAASSILFTYFLLLNPPCITSFNDWTTINTSRLLAESSVWTLLRISTSPGRVDFPWNK